MTGKNTYSRGASKAAQRKCHRSGERLPYAAPRLKEFGPVSALTQAGTGLSSEVMRNGNLSMSPNQRA